MRRLLLTLGLLVAVSHLSCTDANLYSPTRLRKEANRLSLTGRVCTEDPIRAKFPVRVVLLVDQAAGPLFSDFDPAALRVGLLNQFVQDVINVPEAEMAIIGYGGRPQKLAPTEGDFTRNPGELFNAVTQFSLPQACLGVDQCRDYRDALRSARSLIEGELATMPEGERVLTQFVVVMVNAGPHQPLALGSECCEDDDVQCIAMGAMPSPVCETLLGAQDVGEMRELVNINGAGGLRFHGIHLAAEPMGPDNDRVQRAMEAMVFAGGGLYQRFNLIGGLSDASLKLLEIRTVLKAKLLVASNMNALPGPTGPRIDTDGDGLNDEEERALGTSPGNRDTDQDGITDRVEVFAGFDPFTPDLPQPCIALQLGADSDLDLLTDCDEELLGTSPTLVDSDGDGLPDPLEVYYTTDYVERDAERDIDGDGVTNGDEVVQHSDPRSTDTRAHLSFGYRYDIVDEGITRELFASVPELLTGVEVVTLSGGTTPGLGVIRYSSVNHSLSWQDAGDADPGPPVVINGGGAFKLPSSSFAPVQGDEGRVITVEVDEVNLPPSDITDQVRVVFQDRQCLSYDIRNIQMMPTGALDSNPDEPGWNNILVFFAEAPEGRATSPGPFRMAQINVRFVPPDVREPPDAVLEIQNDEFVRPRIQPVVTAPPPMMP